MTGSPGRCCTEIERQGQMSKAAVSSAMTGGLGHV